MFGNGGNADDRQSGTGGATGATAAATAAQQTYQAAGTTVTPTPAPDAGVLPQGLSPMMAAMGAVDPAASLDALPRRSITREYADRLDRAVAAPTSPTDRAAAGPQRSSSPLGLETTSTSQTRTARKRRGPSARPDTLQGIHCHGGELASAGHASSTDPAPGFGGVVI